MLSTETVVKRGLVTEKVKATEIIKEHQKYCDTEREIKHFAAETLAYVTPVSGLTDFLVCTLFLSCQKVAYFLMTVELIRCLNVFK